MSTSLYLPREISLQLESLVSKLRRRQITDPMEIALSTAYLVKLIISSAKSQDASSLIGTVRSFGVKITKQIPNELVVSNIVRRTLHIIREEYHVQTQKSGRVPISPSDYSKDIQDFKILVLDGIKEMIDELETQALQIANQAVEFVHSHQIILTLGYSRTVLQFLQKAGKTRRFQVFVCENAPSFDGQKMALALSNLGIETTLITDSAIYAVMARVNVCFLGANSVTANGGLVASAGTTALATAAKSYMVPVCVCVGLYKLSPISPKDAEQFDLCVSPEPVLDFDDIDMNNVDAINPQLEYVSPDLITLFVTNVGPHPPSYMEKLLPDFYSPEDNVLDD